MLLPLWVEQVNLQTDKKRSTKGDSDVLPLILLTLSHVVQTHYNYAGAEGASEKIGNLWNNVVGRLHFLTSEIQSPGEFVVRPPREVPPGNKLIRQNHNVA